MIHNTQGLYAQRVQTPQTKERFYVLEIPPAPNVPVAVEITYCDFGIITTPIRYQEISPAGQKFVPCGVMRRGL